MTFERRYRRRSNSRWLAFSVLAAGLFMAVPSRAESTPEQCASAAEEGEELQKSGRLLAANDLLVRCVAVECPRVVRSLCGVLLDQVQRTLPSIVVKPRDPEGRDIADGRVTVDNGNEGFATDGRPIPLDPGPHRLRIEWQGKSIDHDIVLTVGEQLREVRAQFVDRSSVERLTPSPTAPLITTGVSLLAFGGFAYFGVMAGDEIDAMRRDCAPTCPSTDVDRARAQALAADISLGLAVVTLGAAVWLWSSYFSSRGSLRARETSRIFTW